MDEVNSAERPPFEIGQAVLVDQGLPGRVTAAERGSVPGVMGEPPEDTWLYTVKSEDGSDDQTNVPEYNLVAQPAEASQGKPLA